MKRTYAWRDGQLVELTSEAVESLPYVQPDLAAFRSPDGKRIGGRAEWREHLKRTDSIEMGHSDIKAMEKQWEKRKEANKKRLNQDTGGQVKPATMTESMHPLERSRIGVEMANRLHNRPAPDRKQLIILAMETARDVARRK